MSIKPFTLSASIARCRQDATNKYYPIICEIDDAERLSMAAMYDHIAGKFKNDQRDSDSSLEWTDVIIVDVDNAPASNKKYDYPAEMWITPSQLHELLPDVMFMTVDSRSSGQVKAGRPARQKYHCYFPLRTKITSPEAVHDLKQDIADLFSVVDGNALNAGRFLFAVSTDKNFTPHVEEFTGILCIDEYLATLERPLQSRTPELKRFIEDQESENKTQENKTRAQQKSTSSSTVTTFTPTGDDVKDELLKALHTIPISDVDHALLRNCGYALKRAGLSFSDFYAWAGTEHRGKKPTDTYLQKQWNSLRGNGAITPEYIFGVAKKYGYQMPSELKQYYWKKNHPAESTAEEFNERWVDSFFNAAATVTVDPETGEVVEVPSPADQANGGAADQKKAAGYQWPELETLEPEKKDKLPEFPVDVYPDYVQDYVNAVADELQVPVDMPAMMVLATFATASQGNYKVVALRKWTEDTNLYIALFAAPSERKSAVMKKATERLNRAAAEENARLEPIRRKALKDSRRLQKRIDALEAAAARPTTKPEDGERYQAEADKLDEKLAEIQIPADAKLLVDDVTPERLGIDLRDHNERISIYSAEGGVFKNFSGLYSGGTANIDVLLKAWDGETKGNGRVSEGKTYTLTHPLMTQFFMVQPKVISDMMGNADFLGSGFNHRYLYVDADHNSRVGTRNLLEEHPVPDAVEDEFWKHVNELLNEQLVPPENPKIISLSEAALIETNKFFMKADRMQAEMKEHRIEKLAEWTGKLHGETLRIAGLLHLMQYGVDAGAELLDADTIVRVNKIGWYLFAHAENVYREAGMADTQEVKDARYIWKRISTEVDADGIISKREALRRCRAFRTMSDMTPGLEELKRRGYIRTGMATLETGQKVNAIMLNPEALKTVDQTSRQDLTPPPSATDAVRDPEGGALTEITEDEDFPFLD